MEPLTALIAKVDADFEEQAALASELVALPSVTGEEGAVAGRLERWFLDNGFESERSTVGAELRDRYPSLAAEVALGSRPNVFGRLRAADPHGGPLVLNGHTDVVATGPRELWDDDPFSGRIRDGRLWGRGSVDMKGPLSCALFALRAVRDLEFDLPFDVEVQCVIAEERGGLGTLSALDTQPAPWGAVVLEPTGGKVCPASGGSLWFTVTVPGRAAHACVAWEGASAFDHAIKIYEALSALGRERNARLSHPLFDRLPSKVPWAVGTVSAGEWPGTVPDQATLRGRIGVLPGESLADVRRETADAVGDACRADQFLAAEPAVLSWDNEGFPAWETATDAAIVRTLVDADQVLGGCGQIGAVTYGSDAGHFFQAGHPVVLFGPGDIVDAHMKNESIRLEDLRRGTRTLAVMLAIASTRRTEEEPVR